MLISKYYPLIGVLRYGAWRNPREMPWAKTSHSKGAASAGANATNATKIIRIESNRIDDRQHGKSRTLLLFSNPDACISRLGVHVMAKLGLVSTP